MDGCVKSLLKNNGVGNLILSSLELGPRQRIIDIEESKVDILLLLPLLLIPFNICVVKRRFMTYVPFVS